MLFEFVGDTELVAFSEPLLTAFSRPVAIGELVGGARDGTLVLILPRAELTVATSDRRLDRAAAHDAGLLPEHLP